jgi:hypothetical protein
MGFEGRVWNFSLVLGTLITEVDMKEYLSTPCLEVFSDLYWVLIKDGQVIEHDQISPFAFPLEIEGVPISLHYVSKEVFPYVLLLGGECVLPYQGDDGKHRYIPFGQWWWDGERIEYSCS